MQYLESKIEVARKTPAEIDRLASELEATARAKLHDLRHALTRPADRRQVFLAMFPKGVHLAPSIVQFVALYIISPAETTSRLRMVMYDFPVRSKASCRALASMMIESGC